MKWDQDKCSSFGRHYLQMRCLFSYNTFFSINKLPLGQIVVWWWAIARTSDCIVSRCTVYHKTYAHGFCFVVVIHWLIFTYPSGVLHWHCGNLTIAPVPAKQPWWIWKKYFMWIHYERLHNLNKAKHNETVCIFLGMYCICGSPGLNVFTKISSWSLSWHCKAVTASK